MPDFVVCSNCGASMYRIETVDGREIDWTNEANPICPKCRGVPGAKPASRPRDVLGGMPWKRDQDGKKVPR